MILTAIPSPPRGVWHIGPFPLRAYALAILCGIIVGWLIAERRYRRRGGPETAMGDVSVWMILFGIIGARIYHVITTPEPYFGPDGDPIKAFYIWNGGLGIWGAVAVGAVGAAIALRRRNLRVAPFADAVAPALLCAQAIGRLGNWFNQELFGAPTDKPWGLRIDQAHLPPGYAPGTLFHPTFLYELLWCLAMAVVLLALEKRLRLRNGQVFWTYVALYTLGRVWIENLRIDQAQHILGLRLNVWTSLIVFTVALAMIQLISKRGVQRYSPPSTTDLTDPAWPESGPFSREDPWGIFLPGYDPHAADQAADKNNTHDDAATSPAESADVTDSAGSAGFAGSAGSASSAG